MDDYGCDCGQCDGLTQDLLSMQKEERVVDPKTGGEKGRKEEEMAFLDPIALREVAKVAGMGARKYEKFNFLRGYDWSLSMNALQRHLMQMWSGEDIDEESGLLHSAHAAWHALALVSFQRREIGNDDRPPRLTAPVLDTERMARIDKAIGSLFKVQAYCLKCRRHREINNPLPITMKNGKKAVEGTCPVCSTRMFKIGDIDAFRT